MIKMKKVFLFFIFIMLWFLWPVLLIQSCSENSIGTSSPPEQTINKILFTGRVNNDPGLFIVESNSQNLRKTNSFTECYAPQWTPDGTRILYLKGLGSNHELFIMDSSGTNEQKVADSVDYFAVSPDGNRICYIFFNGNWEIYLCNIDGSNKVKLTNTLRQKFGLFWSPVNPEIAFTENDNISGSYENIYRIKVDSGVLDTLAVGYDLPQISSWSKDGNFILFGANHAEVFKIDLPSKEIIQLTNAAYRDERASFSPDGQKILFETGREFGVQIYMMNWDGSNQHKVSKFENSCMYPKWSPDGTSISYITSFNGLPRIVIADSYGNNAKYLIPDTLSFQSDWDWNPVK